MRKLTKYLTNNIIFGTAIIFYLIIILFGCSGAPEITSSVKPNVFLSKIDRISVLPSKLGVEDDLLLPDAIENELLGFGLDIIDRSMVKQMIQEKGLDFTEILNGAEYIKIGDVTEVDIIVLVNSKFIGQGISNATLKVISLANNETILSVTYSQPAPDNPTYINFDNINETARKMVEPILNIVQK